MAKVRLKYIGPSRKDGKTRKIVELPIPFVSKCEKTGEVICDPVGEFEATDAKKLLAIAPELFIQVENESVSK